MLVFSVVSMLGATSAMAGAVKTVNGLSMDMGIANAQRGVSYSYQVTITGGTAPYHFEIAGGALPLDFSMSGSGLITGVSCRNPNGSYKFDVQVTDSEGEAVTAIFTNAAIQMNAGPAGACSVTVGVGGIGTSGTVGVSYSGSASSSGGTGPYTYSISSGSLPPGLSLSESGVLSGTPTTAGTYTFTVQSQDSGGTTGTASVTITIAPGATPITVTPSSLPNGTAGTSYSATIGATGGSGTYSNFAVTSGALPSGLSLNASNGAISGVPASAGSASFTITVMDSAERTGNRAYSITIAAAIVPITVTPSSLPNGTVGTSYSATIGATGGSGTYSNFAVTSGALPSGLSLNASNGAISGVPASAGSASFTITVMDSAERTGNRAYSIAIAPPPIVVTPAGLPGATVNTPYSTTIGATGGTGIYSNFAVTSGALPSGLSLNATSGVLSGTPASAGSSTFTVTVTDNGENLGTRSFTLVVAAAGAITVGPASLPQATANAPYTQTVTASGCAEACTFSVGTGLPPGLALNAASGVLSGTPTTPGTYTFTVTATEGTNSGSKTFTIVVVNPITVTPETLAGATVGVAYNQTIGATGGTGTYTGFTVSAGALPAGLSLASGSGVLSGTPSAAGVASFTVTATDSASNAGARAYTLTVSAPAPGAIVVTPAALADGSVGSAYAVTFGATGGSGRYTKFALASGALPAGLVLDGATGALSGIPTAPGAARFTVTVTDSARATGSRAFTLTIGSEARMTIRPGSLPDGTIGVAYAQSFSAAGGTAPYRYSVSSGALPSGLGFDGATGAVAGTPRTAGQYTFTVRATDAPGRQATVTVTVTIVAGATITIGPDGLPASLSGGRYETSVAASGGSAPYRYDVVSGSLPPGLTLDPATGVISGTPNASGAYRFTVKATDSKGVVGLRDYTITVNARPDPTRDAQVAGLVDGQMQMGVRFAGAQIDNVMQHLQGSRGAFECGIHQEIALGLPQNPGAAIDPTRPASVPQASMPSHKRDNTCGAFHNFAFWTAGSIDSHADGRAPAFSATGLDAGVDVLVARNLVLGGAFGTSFDGNRIGSAGTTDDARSLSLALYGGYRPRPRLYVEWMGGYGSLDQDNGRFVTGTTAVLASARSGRLLYGSVSVGAELRARAFFASPYLRNDLSSVRLDASRESGPATVALGFSEARQTVDVLVAGSRFGYEARTSWGRIAPLARFEYRHRFASRYTQSVFYADHPETLYDMARVGESRDAVQAAAGLELAFSRVQLSVEYGTSAASFDGFGGGALRASARVGF